MSFPTNHWPFDGTSFNFLPWNHNPTSDDDNSQPQQQPINPPTPRYLPYPPPQHSSSSSSPYPRLPLPHFAQSRPHSTAAQPRPQQHSTPSASLHAALREGTDFLPRPSIVPRLPPLSRVNSASNQLSSFGYIPNHFFYSPPQSPQDSDPPHHITTTNSPRQPAASSSTQIFAGPSFTNRSVGPSVVNPLAHPQAIDHPTPLFDTERMASAFRSEQTQSQYQNPTRPQHVKEESPNTMPASTSTAASSRKRARPSDLGSPPSATKRRLKPAPASAPIELDNTDEDEIEELGPDNDILAKEREALVTKQREESNKVSRIGELNCMICLEHFTNMTATHCGHIFCHECLTQALVASQRNSDHNYGTCPACRKPIKPKGKTQIVPLSLMKARKK